MTKTETERRYLVYQLAPNILKGRKPIEISQGYFESTSNQPVRIRSSKFLNDRKKDHSKLGQKWGRGISRKEDEILFPPLGAKHLLERAHYNLKKDRYLIDGWELDIYHAPLKPLMILEREKSANAPLPSWVERCDEVTNSLTNYDLAQLAHFLKLHPEQSAEYQLPIVRLPHLVLTGGPGSGKSTLIRIIEQKFGDQVKVIPEIATELMTGLKVGVPQKFRQNLEFNRAIYHLQCQYELVGHNDAVLSGKKLVIVDRGSVDLAAYLPRGLEELEHLCLTDRSYEYGKYDQVMILGLPSKKIYDQIRRDNPVRTETYLKAKALQKNILSVWGGHPNCSWLNPPTLEPKVRAVIETVRRYL